MHHFINSQLIELDIRCNIRQIYYLRRHFALLQGRNIKGKFAGCYGSFKWSFGVLRKWLAIMLHKQFFRSYGMSDFMSRNNLCSILSVQDDVHQMKISTCGLPYSRSSCGVIHFVAVECVFCHNLKNTELRSYNLGVLRPAPIPQ